MVLTDNSRRLRRGYWTAKKKMRLKKKKNQNTKVHAVAWHSPSIKPSSSSLVCNLEVFLHTLSAMVVHTTVLCLNATTWCLLGKHGQRPSSCYFSWFSASQHSCEWRSTLVFQCPIHVYREVTIVSFAVTTISNLLDHSYLLVLVKLIILVVGSCFPPCWWWQNSQCLWRGISVFITMPATNWEHPIP